MEPNFLSRLLYTIFENLPIIPVAGFGLGEMMMALGASIINMSIALLNIALQSTNSVLDPGGSSGLPAITEAIGKLESVTDSAIGISKSLGYVLSFVFWVIAVFEMLIQERLTPETLVKSLARFGVCFVLIDNAKDIHLGLKSFGVALTNDFAPLADKGAEYLDTPEISFEALFAPPQSATDVIANIVSSSPLGAQMWIAMLVYSLLIAIPILLFAGAYYLTICLIQCSRLIELEIRAMFLPIGFSLLADDGWKGAGGRYVKKYTAICCQGIILVLLGGLAETLMSSVVKASFGPLFNAGGVAGLITVLFEGGLDVPSMFTGICMMWGVGIAVIALMFKSINLVNEVFGA